MTEKLKQLRQQFEAKHASVQTLLAKTDITSEDIASIEAMQGEMETMKGQILALQGAVQKSDTLAAFLNQPATTLPQPGQAHLLGMKPAGSTQIESNGDNLDVFGEGEGLLSEKQMQLIRTKEYKQAFRAYLKSKGNIGSLRSAEYKVLEEGIDNEGGFLVPQEMLNRIIQKQPAPTRVAARTTQLTTSRDALTMPKVVYATDDIYSTGMRVTYTGEIPASSTAHRVTQPVFGNLRIPIYTAMMSLPISNDLLEDSMFPLLSWSSDKFAETINLHKDNMTLNGTGAGQPRGILPFVNTTDGVTQVLSTSAGAVIADNFVTLPFELPEQYIDNAAWVFNRASTGKTVASFKASTNEYLFRQGDYDNGLAARRPDTLSGYPIAYSAFMPNAASTAFPVLFGDLGGYFNVARVGFSIQILREVYAEVNQIVMLGRFRHGGDTAEPFRMRALKSNNS